MAGKFTQFVANDGGIEGRRGGREEEEKDTDEVGWRGGGREDGEQSTEIGKNDEPISERGPQTLAQGSVGVRVNRR